MKEDNEEPVLPSTTSETLSDIRRLSIQCKDGLSRLCGDHDPTGAVEARELVASFNIWATNMGVFRDGQQSMTWRLKTAPQISELVQQSLVALDRDIVKSLIQGHKEGELPTTESEDSSDRSSTSSYRLVSPSDHGGNDDDEVCSINLHRSTSWISIRDTISSLHQLVFTIRLAGTQYRQDCTQRFRDLEENKQEYEVVERSARQMVDLRFPKATVSLRERMAESIATRRVRALYLEQHQKQTSTSGKPDPKLDRLRATEERESHPSAQLRQQQETILLPHPIDDSKLLMDPSMLYPTTGRTTSDPEKPQAGQKNTNIPVPFISSLEIPTHNFPSRPKLDPGGTSFTCPYCFLVCPASEVSDETQWMNHLIYDLEPFFCVFDNCHSPFVCANTYNGWLTHMRKSHTEPRWHCWYCDAATPFFSAEELQKHLERNHQREVTDSLRKTVMKHSLVYDQHALQYCPFCDCFPEEIEDRYADRNADEAQEALEQHVKGHLLSLSLIPASVEIAEDDVVTQGFRERDRLLAPVEVADEDAIPQGFRERKREHGKTRIFSPNSSTGNPRKKPRRSDPNGVRFACPYHKKNWARYSSGPCNGKGFENIDRLKTHLKDYHDLSEHWRRCHICKKRFLRDQLDTHSPCERRDEWDDYEDGYDVDQAQDLKKDETRTRKNPPESCWKAIFRVLFPNWPADHDTPSPYQAKTGSTDYTDAIHQHRNGVMGDHTMSQLGDCQSNDERRQVLEPFFRELERNLVYTQMTTGHLPPRPVSAQPTIVVNTQPPQYQLPPVPQLAYNYGHGRRLQLPTPALSSSDANSHRHLQSVDPSDTFTDWTEFSDQMSIGLDSLGSYQAMNSSNTLPQFNTERTITVAQQPMGNTSHNPVPDFAAGNEETALDDWTTFLNGPQHQPQSVGGYLVQDDLKQEDYDENEMPSMAP